MYAQKEAGGVLLTATSSQRRLFTSPRVECIEAMPHAEPLASTPAINHKHSPAGHRLRCWLEVGKANDGRRAPPIRRPSSFRGGFIEAAERLERAGESVCAPSDARIQLDRFGMTSARS